ncbi:MAG TPA: DUF393 domain-containing protein [Longimicrobiales bacterium]
MNQPYTVIYDGNCRVCTRIVGTLRRWDTGQQLEIIPSETPGLAARFPWIAARAYADSLQVVSGAGQTWQGAASIEQLLSVLPRGRFISWIFRVPLVRGIAERCYRWFARNRYRLGCSEHCERPEQSRDH